MTVDELIEYLEEYRGLEVRLGIQPGYPLQTSINTVISNGDLIEEGDKEVCYILAGKELGYATKKLWEE